MNRKRVPRVAMAGLPPLKLASGGIVNPLKPTNFVDQQAKAFAGVQEPASAIKYSSTAASSPGVVAANMSGGANRDTDGIYQPQTPAPPNAAVNPVSNQPRTSAASPQFTTPSRTVEQARAAMLGLSPEAMVNAGIGSNGQSLYPAAPPPAAPAPSGGPAIGADGNYYLDGKIVGGFDNKGTWNAEGGQFKTRADYDAWRNAPPPAAPSPASPVSAVVTRPAAAGLMAGTSVAQEPPPPIFSPSVDQLDAQNDTIKYGLPTGETVGYGGKLDYDVTDSYKRELGRDADPSGRAYWRAQLAAGKTPEEIQKAMNDTAEGYDYNVMNDKLDDKMFVDRLFKMLGRRPEAGDYAHWQGRAAAGQDRKQLATAMRDFARSQGKTIADDEIDKIIGQGDTFDVKKVIDDPQNKTYVDLINTQFRLEMGRAPTEYELAKYVQGMRDGRWTAGGDPATNIVGALRTRKAEGWNRGGHVAARQGIILKGMRKHAGPAPEGGYADGGTVGADDPLVAEFIKKYGSRDFLDENGRIMEIPDSGNMSSQGRYVINSGDPTLYGRSPEEYMQDPTRIMRLPDGRYIYEAGNIKPGEVAGYQRGAETDRRREYQKNAKIAAAIAAAGYGLAGGFEGMFGPEALGGAGGVDSYAASDLFGAAGVPEGAAGAGGWEGLGPGDGMSPPDGGGWEGLGPGDGMSPPEGGGLPNGTASTDGAWDLPGNDTLPPNPAGETTVPGPGGSTPSVNPSTFRELVSKYGLKAAQAIAGLISSRDAPPSQSSRVPDNPYIVNGQMPTMSPIVNRAAPVNTPSAGPPPRALPRPSKFGFSKGGKVDEYEGGFVRDGKKLNPVSGRPVKTEGVKPLKSSGSVRSRTFDGDTLEEIDEGYANGGPVHLAAGGPAVPMSLEDWYARMTGIADTNDPLLQQMRTEADQWASPQRMEQARTRARESALGQYRAAARGLRTNPNIDPARAAALEAQMQPGAFAASAAAENNATNAVEEARWGKMMDAMGLSSKETDRAAAIAQAGGQMATSRANTRDSNNTSYNIANMNDQTRRYDIDTGDRRARDFMGEDTRRWDYTTGEDARRWGYNVGEDARRWNTNFGQRQYEYDTTRGDTRFDRAAQYGLDAARINAGIDTGNRSAASSRNAAIGSGIYYGGRLIGDVYDYGSRNNWWDFNKGGHVKARCNTGGKVPMMGGGMMRDENPEEMANLQAGNVKDTIDAKLAPGEFVLNPEAVDIAEQMDPQLMAQIEELNKKGLMMRAMIARSGIRAGKKPRAEFTAMGG